MAFEGFLSSHGARRRIWSWGHAVSGAAHVVPIALGLALGMAAAKPARPAADARLGIGAPGVRVRLPQRLAHAPERAAARAGEAAGPKASAVVGRRGRAVPARRRPTRPHAAGTRRSPPPFAPAVAAAARVAVPPPAAASGPLATALGSASLMSPPTGPAASAPVTAAAPKPPTPARAPSGPPYVASAVAKGLRIHEVFPPLPSSLDRAGARYETLVDVCVSPSGSVSAVTIKQAGAAALDREITEAIRTWRYQPWTIDGRPTPFCHPLRITYVRQ